ncbi:expressed unknown protein [Seminavis robusta]|uniref:Uncharacterized protein n=1 Tax=Seminavis robusta TaxID=568900 RepID=A0A9N8E843_9STRA|nr:expressed unknown protein [Seminavis robusta]|eukprot:Sro649_g181240.1 n/a (289) ;mRNA; r:38221-39087
MSSRSRTACSSVAITASLDDLTRNTHTMSDGCCVDMSTRLLLFLILCLIITAIIHSWGGTLFQPLVFLATVVVFIVSKQLACRTSSQDCSDFQVSVQAVKDQIMSDATAAGDLLQPPASAVYRLEDRQFGIVHKKSGDVLLEGSHSLCVMRLNFATDLKESSGLVSLKGSRVLVGPSAANTTSKSNQQQQHNNTSSVIIKGLVATATRKAYFVEETSTKDSSGRRISRVVSGNFEGGGERYKCFSGEWLASDGSRGSVTNIPEAPAVDYAIPLVIGEEEGEQADIMVV